MSKLSYTVITRVDYFSYTYFVYPDDNVQIESHMLIREILNHKPDYITFPDEVTLAPHRKGFSVGLALGNHTYVWINKAGLMLVEHTGKGCELLSNEGILSDVVGRYADRATRIDIASDILTGTMPDDFCKSASPAKRITASGHQSSDTGQTIYLGSRKSDRTCKVYRYFPPHPRADFLRIEYTYRKKQAKVVAGMIAQGHSIAEISVASGKRYGWAHECYKPHVSPEFEIAAWRPERRTGKTVMWLYSQVLPAMRKLLKEGAFDLDDFLSKLEMET